MTHTAPKSNEMELWACGLNAWNQLCFDDAGFQGPTKQPEPEDAYSFVRIMSAEAIERPVAKLSYTLVRKNGTLCAAGEIPHPHPSLETLYTTIESGSGQVLDLVAELRKVSEAEAISPCLYKIYSPLKDALADRRPGKGKAVAAYDTGFAVLAANNDSDDAHNQIVLTMGDARYQACLGRDVDRLEPATTLNRIHDLCHLPDNATVAKLSAGGYTLGALTTSGDVYLWGHGPGNCIDGGDKLTRCGAPPRNTHPVVGAVASPSDRPEPLETPDNKDIQDFALGELHAILLAQDGCVYTRGSNSNGQLGIGRDGEVESVVGTAGHSWAKIELDLPPGHHVVGVDAGPRCSFIITSNI